MQRAAREMAKHKSGKIINIASIAGKGFRGTSNIAYAGTKGAVIAMTRIAASQLARFNINVNAICPGATRTHMFETLMQELIEKRGMSEEDAINASTRRFRWDDRTRPMISRTWRPSWPRRRPTISPANRSTSMAAWCGINVHMDSSRRRLSAANRAHAKAGQSHTN